MIAAKRGYDPSTGAVNLPESASLYAKFHELGHKNQHLCYPVIFIVMVSLSQIPILGYFVKLAMEWDAYRRAKRQMRYLGLWNKDRAREAGYSLRSYIWR